MKGTLVSSGEVKCKKVRVIRRDDFKLKKGFFV